jgi:hypothetical protein
LSARLSSARFESAVERAVQAELKAARMRIPGRSVYRIGFLV